MSLGPNQIPSREYTIVGVLGRGGFGTVYHARMTAQGGFSKDVAIKVLSDEDPPQDVLGRFRDEARILGMLRDPNIVWVDPPIRLDGHWAVVMEYVDGESCQALRRYGAMPCRVVLEVIGKVARTLDNLWDFEGPDGQPLQLLHRDIKPANLQITPKGGVKLLDFGIARARFDQREVHTHTNFAGTPGYIAPERLHGDEGPHGDIYSLGVVLHVLFTAQKPPAPGKSAPRPEGLTAVEAATWALSEKMRSLDPSQRPSAKEVAQLCDHLVREWSGSGLREWASQHVNKRPVTDGDPLVGSVMQPSMTLTVPAVELPTMSQTQVAAMVMVPVGGTVILGAMLATALLTVGLTVWWLGLRGGASPESLVIEAAAPVARQVVAAPKPSAPIEPVDVAPVPVPLQAPSPAPTEPKTRAPVVLPEPPDPVLPDPGVVSPPEIAEEPVEAGRFVSKGGAERLEFRGGGEVFSVGEAPPGAYAIWADFGSGMVQVGRVRLESGQQIGIRCHSSFKRCVVE